MNFDFLVDILKSIIPTSIQLSEKLAPASSLIWNLNWFAVVVPTILLLSDNVKYISLLITLFKKVSEVFALFEIKFIKLPEMVVESPKKSAISFSVSRTAGAPLTRLPISVAVSALVYASIPLIVIESSVDVKFILSPGIKFFILLLINNVFEFVASVVLLNVACFIYIRINCLYFCCNFIFIICINSSDS